MLELRILTALILLPLVIALVLLAPTWLLALVAGLVTLVATWEWASLSGETAEIVKVSRIILVAVLLYLLWTARHDRLVLWVVALMALGWWSFALVWVTWWRREFPRPAKLFCGLLTLVPAWVATVALHQSPRGPVKLLFLLALIWAADSAAYFAGRAFGRHKLAPAVSPGKTWEGVAGGTLAMLVVALLGTWWVLPASGYFLILICVLTGWLSIVGDLSESLFKREAGVKDSGVLFPGHGGVLDRIDSLTVAVPVFWIGLALLEWLR
ncbi:MAG: phosphatidate cytidylyltransferase [Gammaproteobacteria bacterium]